MMKLRQNWIVQELVEAFQRARPTILQMGKNMIISRQGDGENKRKREEAGNADLEDDKFDHNRRPRRHTRSYRKSPSALSIIAAEPTGHSDGEQDPGSYRYEKTYLSNAHSGSQLMGCQLVQFVESG